jgi:hypothetical protein
MSNGTMPESMRRTAAMWIAVVTLVVVVGALLGSVDAATHSHRGPGLYDANCPLAALAAVDRASTLVVSTASMPIVAASALVALPLGVGAILAPAAGVRFRAPPTR